MAGSTGEDFIFGRTLVMPMPIIGETLNITVAPARGGDARAGIAVTGIGDRR